MKWVLLVALAPLVLSSVAGAGDAVPCTLEHWTWENYHDRIDVRGIVSPSTVRSVYVQGFDKDGKFLGVHRGLAGPDGSFFVFFDGTTDKLSVKVSCD
jgi:hypothetical protein